MKRIIATVAVMSLLGGCAFLTPKPRPESALPPAEDQSDERTGTASAPSVADPVQPVLLSIAPDPNRQEIPGWWISRAALGSASANVRKVEMIFQIGGAFNGTMLFQVDDKQRYVNLEGTWRSEESKLVVTFNDGRVQTWLVAWDGGTLILKSGESELRLQRMPE